MSNPSKIKFLIVVLVLLAIIGGLSGGDDPQVENEQTNDTVHIANEPLTREDKILDDLKSAQRGMTITKVTIRGFDNYLVVKMSGNYDGDGPKYLSNCIQTSFAIMDVVTTKNYNVSGVDIIAESSMIDEQGNRNMATVYEADTTIEDAENVKWGNLADYPNIDEAWRANFDLTFANSQLWKVR